MDSKFHLIQSILNRPETVRKQHLRTAIYLTLGLTLILIIFTANTLIRARDDRSEKLLSRKIEIVENEFMHYFELLDNNTKLFVKWGNSGVIDTAGELSEIDSKIIPMVEEYPFLISVCITGSDSSYYMLSRMDKPQENSMTINQSFWQSFRSRKDSLGIWQTVTRPDTTYALEPEFLEMVHSGELFASLSGTSEEPDEATLGTTTPITDERAGSSTTFSYEYNGLTYFATFNIDTGYVERNIQSLSISESGQVYLVTRYQTSTMEDDLENFGNDSANIEYASLRTKVLDKALFSWNEGEETKPFNFRVDGMLWCGMAKSPNNDQISRWVMVALPEDELFTELEEERNSLFFFTILILVFGSVLFMILVRLYNRAIPVQYITSQEEKGKELLDLIKKGESDKLEFKSTLRWNLKADKADKNIEKSALKTLVAYFNSEGGKLLVGVEDDGNILGIKADKFPNDDRFMLHLNNMIKQHIGLEFSKWIHYRIIEEEDKKVLLVECDKSGEPAFLMIGEDEDFYIRVGPASRKLSTKQSLSFLMNNDEVNDKYQ
jgi:Schlafen, AlbA_2